jgi:putative molybdopterin biosynthesis protein
VWLDAQLRRVGIPSGKINGYDSEVKTHSQVAQAVAENQADAGLAVESAASAWGLNFVPLTVEPYDLAIPAEAFQRPPIQALANWLNTEVARQAISSLGGYETGPTGQVRWVS